MSGWMIKKLKDVIDFNYGKGLPQRDRQNGPYPVYGSSGIVDYHKESLVSGPGLIIGRKGNVGSVYWEVDNYYPIDTVYYVSDTKDGSNLKYLYYLLQTLSLDKLNSDAAVPGLNRAQALNLTTSIPKAGYQKRITEIIEKYDLLIDNNKKRINILEEMAQRLYTEWFVKFNFPGHENVKMVDSGSEFGEIPEGWEIGKIGDKLNVKYGKTLPKTKIEKSGKYPVYGAGGIIGYYGSKNINSCTTLITCRGNGSGTVWRTRGEGFVTNNSLIIEGFDEELPFCFLYYAMKNSNISSSISGSAQPQITINNLNYVSFINPNKEIVDKFNMITTNYFRLIDQAVVFSKNIQTIRDLLIENLVTGKRSLKN